MATKAKMSKRKNEDEDKQRIAIINPDRCKPKKCKLE
jgi:hypothetical protein